MRIKSFPFCGPKFAIFESQKKNIFSLIRRESQKDHRLTKVSSQNTNIFLKFKFGHNLYFCSVSALIRIFSYMCDVKDLSMTVLEEIRKYFGIYCQLL